VSIMSEYCKAYPVKRFREYPLWSERQVAGLHVEMDQEDRANDAAAVPRPLADDDVLFLHDTYQVTDGVFADEHVVFDAVTPEWRTFCGEVLGFDVPDDARAASGGEPDGAVVNALQVRGPAAGDAHA
jgi:hypothetical protein